MNNGCICCTVRGDLIRILAGLMRRREKFDHALVETTGMADPSPVAQTFFVDTDVRSSRARLGRAVVTVADARWLAAGGANASARSRSPSPTARAEQDGSGHALRLRDVEARIRARSIRQAASRAIWYRDNRPMC